MWVKSNKYRQRQQQAMKRKQINSVGNFPNCRRQSQYDYSRISRTLISNISLLRKLSHNGVVKPRGGEVREQTAQAGQQIGHKYHALRGTVEK